jgi:hypothetical protein
MKDWGLGFRVKGFRVKGLGLRGKVRILTRDFNA